MVWGLTYTALKERSHTASPIPQISDGAHAQNACPLFSILPAEIRQRIYEYALSSFDDPSKPFNPQHHHYRPGHRYWQKHDFRLLQTCKRVWQEAHLLPISLNEMTIYLHRGPRSNQPSKWYHDWRSRYHQLNRDQRAAVHTVHFFAQQCYLESTPFLLEPLYNDHGLRSDEARKLGADETAVMTAKRFVLTLRRSDWWTWESPILSNDLLGICPWREGRTNCMQMEGEPWEGPDGEWNGWGRQFTYVKGLELLEIEFEAVEAKKAQLERVVARAKHWRFPLEHDNVLIWTGELKESTWEGSLSLREDPGDRPVHLRRVQEEFGNSKSQTCTYVVMWMKWRVGKRVQVE